MKKYNSDLFSTGRSWTNESASAKNYVPGDQLHVSKENHPTICVIHTDQDRLFNEALDWLIWSYFLFFFPIEDAYLQMRCTASLSL